MHFVHLPGKAGNLLAVLLLASLAAIPLVAACEEEQEEGEGPTPFSTPTVTPTPAAEVPGITDTEIILGSHVALSGLYGAVYSPLMQALQAYFEYVNVEQGGVCGRKIVLKVEDDSFEPAKAAEAARKLVERDKVFAIVAGLGTAPHSAVWEYLNELEVPDYALDVHTKRGKEMGRKDWKMCYQFRQEYAPDNPYMAKLREEFPAAVGEKEDGDD